MGPLVDCVRCGACCFSQLATYVRVTGDDLARLGDRADEVASFDGHRAYMLMTDGHCAALRMMVDTERFECSVYETRPDVCRDLERGSSSCEAEREAKTDRTLLAIRRTREP